LEYRLPGEGPKKNILKILYELIAKSDERIAKVHEVFDPVTKKWSPMNVQQKMPLYPRMHLLPDGDVFYSGMFNTHFFTPGRFPSARLRPQTLAWMEVGGRHFKKNREEGISVLLALRPPDYKPQILIASVGHTPGQNLMTLLHSIGKDSWSPFSSFLTHVQDTAERIDLARQALAWDGRQDASPGDPCHGVLLPDGNVCGRWMSIYGDHMSASTACQARSFRPKCIILPKTPGLGWQHSKKRGVSLHCHPAARWTCDLDGQ
jgi:hypothetical protein